jgi:CRISPR/Cas system-associated exonuclease Cas4 (RecB family)
MSHLAEKSVKNPVTTEMEKKQRKIFENREASLRDQKHLEMAYEWLRSRGKTDLLKSAMESL